MKRLLMILVLAGAFVPRGGFAQERPHLSEAQCPILARMMADAVTVRDLGADVDKHIALLESQKAANVPLWLSTIVEREVRRVYASDANADRVFADVLSRCLLSDGVMGDQV